MEKTSTSLVQYPSPYKVVDGNLCMEVTEKHSAYDRKLSTKELMLLNCGVGENS